jgi:hypothetical protein
MQMPLRKTYATKESAFEKLRNRKRCVHSIADRRGEHEATVKTIVCGNAGCFPVNSW